MNRIDKKFRELKTWRRKAFIAFLTAGYPSLPLTEKLVLELERSGADIIELGVPFSDPVADGPVIQKSSFEALKKGVTLKKILRLVKKLRKKTEIPLAAMSYFNPILRYGTSLFIEEAVAAGLDGVIIPDLPPDEEKVFLSEANKNGLATIQFIAPTTSRLRASFIAGRARGFIYFVSLTGVTGVRRDLPIALKSQVIAVRKVCGRLPVCAGFGVSTRRHVRFVSSFSDGVIVGSAIVKKISEHLKKKDLVSRVGRFVRDLKGSL
jgi:tryptophan synthase alpha chain